MHIHNKIILTIALAVLFSSPAAAEEITIIATGDIMTAARTIPFTKKFGHDYPYRNVSKILKEGDLVIGNLENPLTLSGERFENKKYTFKAPLETADALKDAGFTHLSLANNHMMDYGATGLNSTIKALDKSGLNYAGAGGNISLARGASIIETKGKKIAFLSYSKTYPVDFYAGKSKAGTASGYKKYIIEDIRKAKEISDIIIVSFHWSGEKVTIPRYYQKELARLSIDEGADIVLGHHPHVLQGIEYYEDGIIFYSLGNFVFGSYSKASKESIIARIRIDDGNIKSVEAIPVNVNNFEVHFQPQILEGSRAEEVISNLSKLSEPMGSKLIFTNGVGVVKKANKPTKK